MRLPGYGKEIVARRMRREEIPFLLVVTDFCFWPDYPDRVVIPFDTAIPDVDLRLVMDLHCLLWVGRSERTERMHELLQALLDCEPRSVTMFDAADHFNLYPIGRLGARHLVTLPEVDAGASEIYRALLHGYGG